MDPLTIGMIAAPVVGGLLGQNAARDQLTAASDARAQALAQFAGIKPPTVEEMQLALQNYQNTGELSPELEQVLSQGDTNLAGVTTDPRLKSEQMAALQQLSGIASGNPQAGDMAGFQLARQNAAGEAQAKNGQILQEMQQRGQAGSGAELLAKLKNSQDSAQMLSTQDMQQAQAMQQARLAALQGQSQLAGNMRNQDYSEQSNLANARDAIARYNTQNSQNVQHSNINTKNNAQAANLQNKQNLANMNTQTQNQQQIANKGLNQQNFNNQLNLATAKSGQYNNQANAAQNQAGNTAGMYAGIGQGVGTVLAGFNKKTNEG